jgi:hypothetical protein
MQGWGFGKGAFWAVNSQLLHQNIHWLGSLFELFGASHALALSCKHYNLVAVQRHS